MKLLKGLNPLNSVVEVNDFYQYVALVNMISTNQI